MKQKQTIAKKTQKKMQNVCVCVQVHTLQKHKTENHNIQAKHQ